MFKIRSHKFPFPDVTLKPACKLELLDDIANFFKAMMVPVGGSKGALQMRS